VYYCPYHPTAGIGKYRRQSACRKPAPGMLLKAKEDFDLDMKRSVLLGDKRSDIEAGKRAGVGLNILIRHENKTTETGQADQVIDNLSKAAVFFSAGHTAANE